MNRIPLFQVRMDSLAPEAVRKVLVSGFIGQGPKVDEFEEALWQEFECAYKPLTVNSCTSALSLALDLCNVGPGDEVISTPMTCYATQVGIQHRYAKIVWADVDPLTGNIDPNDVANLVTSKTKAIMAVDWAGRACDYDALRAFGVPVIEDAAHCWDTRHNHKPISKAGGDYVCYSFQAIKFLTTGDGGALIVNNEEDYERAIRLRWYGMDRRGSNSMRCKQPVLEPGFKYHMNDINAAIGLMNLRLANLSVMQHRINAIKYNMAFKDLTSITCPPGDEGCSYWLYSLLVNKDTKEDFIAHMDSRGIDCSPVHHRNDLYEATSKFKTRDLPGLDYFSERQVSIPVGFWLSQEDIDRVIDAVRSY